MPTSSKSIQSLESEEAQHDQVDPEWIQLLNMARELGFTLDEVRNFFSPSRVKSE